MSTYFGPPSRRPERREGPRLLLYNFPAECVLGVYPPQDTLGWSGVALFGLDVSKPWPVVAMQLRCLRLADATMDTFCDDLAAETLAWSVEQVIRAGRRGFVDLLGKGMLEGPSYSRDRMLEYVFTPYFVTAFDAYAYGRRSRDIVEAERYAGTAHYELALDLLEGGTRPRDVHTALGAALEAAGS